MYWSPIYNFRKYYFADCYCLFSIYRSFIYTALVASTSISSGQQLLILCMKNSVSLIHGLYFVFYGELKFRLDQNRLRANLSNRRRNQFSFIHLKIVPLKRSCHNIDVANAKRNTCFNADIDILLLFENINQPACYDIG